VDKLLRPGLASSAVVIGNIYALPELTVRTVPVEGKVLFALNTDILFRRIVSISLKFCGKKDAILP